MEKEEESQTFYVNDIKVNPQHNEIRLQDQCVRIQPKVMAVLCYLSNHNDRVISNEELIENVWEGRVVTHGSVQKSINALRSALAELDASSEYVTHFSKRGYQLVQAVKQADAPPAPVVPRLPSFHRLLVSISAVLILLGLGIYLFLDYRSEPIPPQKALSDSSSLSSEKQGSWEGITSNPNQGSNLSAPLSFKVAASDIQFKKGSRLPAPHPKGRGLAFIQTVDEGQGAENRIMIQNFNGPSWVLADSHAEWVALEWSSSGRNLVALERWSAQDEFSSSYFYKKPIHFYTFHIFTLDFKGERLIEKNRLSQWHGRVSSVTWWDENTLEFVASQGGQVSLDRYRYQIPDQNLSLLTSMPDDKEPLASSVYNKQAALLVRKNSDIWLEFLSKDNQVQRSFLLADNPSAVSWSPDGAGVVISKPELNQYYFYTLDGKKQALSFDILQRQKINHLVFSHQSLMFWAALDSSEPSALLINEKTDKQEPNNNLSGYSSGVFTPDGQALLTVDQKGNKNYLQLVSVSSRQSHTFGEQLNQLQTVFISSNLEQLNVLADSALWAFNIENQSLKKIAALNLSFRPHIFLVEDKSIWGVKRVDNTRNIFVFSLEDEKSRPVTFGSIGSVLPTAKRLYFQYVDQPGLWAVNYQNQQVSKVENSLPANVKLLAVDQEQIHYIRGQLCHESDVYVLDLKDGKHRRLNSRANHALDTLAYHPSGLSLVRKCSINTSQITKFAR